VTSSEGILVDLGSPPLNIQMSHFTHVSPVMRLSSANQSVFLSPIDLLGHIRVTCWPGVRGKINRNIRIRLTVISVV